MKKELPTYKIHDTIFIVDVMKDELREKADPGNIIPIRHLHMIQNGYYIDYNTRKRNAANPGDEFADIATVFLPPLNSIDPENMARKYGYSSAAEIAGKWDPEVLFGQAALKQRIEKGRLTTVDVAGDIFYVDIPMNILRLHDEFFTNGINFDILDKKYYNPETNTYQFPYDPNTHAIVSLDHNTIVPPPEGTIFFEIPPQRVLDPVGCSRRDGADLLRDYLTRAPVQSHFVAKQVNWDKTFVPKLIQENIRRLENDEWSGYGRSR